MKRWALFVALIFNVLAHGEDVAIYSGSFDPPTRFHLDVMRQALASNNPKIDKLYVMVNMSGEKNFKGSWGERSTLIKAGLGELSEHVEVIPVYQSDKLEKQNQIRAKTKGKVFCYVGSDSFSKLTVESRDAPGAAWLVLPRAGDKTEIPDLPHVKRVELPGGARDISSTKVRLALINRDYAEAAKYLDPAVLRTIRDYASYELETDGDLSLRKTLSEKLFRRYVSIIAEQFPGLNLTGIPAPVPENLQSYNAMTESYIAAIVEANKLKGESLREFLLHAQPLLDLVVAASDSSGISQYVHTCEKRAGHADAPRIHP